MDIDQMTRQEAALVSLEAAIEMITETPEIITPQIMDKAYKVFQIASQEVGIEEPAEVVDLAPSPEYIGQIMMTAIDRADVSGLSEIPDLNYWRSVAEHMGPDWAQGLYHIAVFMTKVA